MPNRKKGRFEIWFDKWADHGIGKFLIHVVGILVMLGFAWILSQCFFVE
jgi:hypothetical protein